MPWGWVDRADDVLKRSRCGNRVPLWAKACPLQRPSTDAGGLRQPLRMRAGDPGATGRWAGLEMADRRRRGKPSSNPARLVPPKSSCGLSNGDTPSRRTEILWPAAWPRKRDEHDAHLRPRAHTPRFGSMHWDQARSVPGPGRPAPAHRGSAQPPPSSMGGACDGRPTWVRYPPVAVTALGPATIWARSGAAGA